MQLKLIFSGNILSNQQVTLSPQNFKNICKCCYLPLIAYKKCVFSPQIIHITSHQRFICSKSTTKTLGKGGKYVQS